MENYHFVDALILNGISLGAVLFFVRRWMTNLDKKLEAIVGRELCAERRAEIKDDIEKFCKKNAEEHKELWKHRHATSGEIIIP